MDSQNHWAALSINLSLLALEASGHPAAKILHTILTTVLMAHEDEVVRLKRLEMKIDALLSQDVETAKEFLRRAASRVEDIQTSELRSDRPSELVISDIQKSQDYFTKALSLVDDDFNKALIRHNIGVCAYLLNDLHLTREEFEEAYRLTSSWKQALNEPLTKAKRDLESAQETERVYKHPKGIMEHIVSALYH